ncbi:233_t:CDS:10 [Funneliformis caledonium]|uniref:Autophagy-related protein 14 n=1 Tax=Funneliformis caledonium TaxID=1117310 RepID=A0A9N9HL49_9GLOM|nr:233_t:CDS:10 [Funneliformis caledonium]
MSSAVDRGRTFELEIVVKLREVEIECMHTGGRGDGGVDIRGRIAGIPYVIQCKNWRHPDTIRNLEGVLTRQPSGTIGVVVAPLKGRFTPGVIETSRTSVYDIILTDKANICKDLIDIVAVCLSRFSRCQMDVGQKSKQNRAPSPQAAKRSYTYDAILRLNIDENCLIDLQRSQDDIISNIGQILEKEKSKLVLQREKSSSSLRLSRYHAEIADKSKALEEVRNNLYTKFKYNNHEDRRRITSLRENIRSRRAALEEAKKRYQTGNEYLEESQKILERDRESLSSTTSKLCVRQRELVADLLTIYPIDPIDAKTFSFKILGVPLPNSVFTGCDDEQVATALGFTCHLTYMLAYYLGVPIRFPMIPMSSRSTIRDPISASLGDSRQFPLHAKGVDRYRFEYAVFLLNKNIEQYLILSLSSGQSSHLRKIIPHNCVMPRNLNNAIASTSNMDHVLEEGEREEHLHSFSKSPNTSNSIISIDSSKRSRNVINTLQKSTIESHRKNSQGFELGVT